MTSRLILVLLLLVALPQAVAAQCRWGSFDASRISYAGGVLVTGAELSTLRTIITANGGTLAPAAPALTAAYLGSIEVFFTSLLAVATGTLSAAEQAALQAWIDAGGTLIVTADISPLPAYESFTAVYGVTGYTQSAAVGTARRRMRTRSSPASRPSATPQTAPTTTAGMPSGSAWTAPTTPSW